MDKINDNILLVRVNLLIINMNMEKNNFKVWFNVEKELKQKERMRYELIKKELKEFNS